MKPTVSVIIITKNEEINIEACLQSVLWADEIIVLDSGSEDRTVEIAKQFTEKVFITDDWPGYGVQKQRALSMATKEWILSLDADERVTVALKAEIETQLLNSSFDGFSIPFRSEYCGRILRFGDWTNDRQTVLFRRNKGQFVSLQVHERIEIDGSIAKLNNPIHHIAFRNLEMVIKKMNEYSTMRASQKYFHGESCGIWKAVIYGMWAFFKGYVIRLGFLDGKEGFMLAVSNAEGIYYRYLKLMLLDQQKKYAIATQSKDVLL